MHREFVGLSPFLSSEDYHVDRTCTSLTNEHRNIRQTMAAMIGNNQRHTHVHCGGRNLILIGRKQVTNS